MPHQLTPECSYSKDTTLLVLFLVESTLASSVTIQIKDSSWHDKGHTLCFFLRGTECGFFNLRVHLPLTVDVLKALVPGRCPWGMLFLLQGLLRHDAAELN